MIGRFTDPIEAFDEDGDGIDRELALINQTGCIKLRDKDFDGEIPQRTLTRQNCYPNSSEYKKDQKARTEAQRQRILLETAIMRARGINPTDSGTAGKFDRLAI